MASTGDVYLQVDRQGARVRHDGLFLAVLILAELAHIELGGDGGEGAKRYSEVGDGIVADRR